MTTRRAGTQRAEELRCSATFYLTGIERVKQRRESVLTMKENLWESMLKHVKDVPMIFKLYYICNYGVIKNMRHYLITATPISYSTHFPSV